MPVTQSKCYTLNKYQNIPISSMKQCHWRCSGNPKVSIKQYAICYGNVTDLNGNINITECKLNIKVHININVHFQP